MFRVSTTPIIRSTQNCNYSLRYCAATSLQRGQVTTFIILQVHFVCFGCQPHPSWVHKTVTTASGTVQLPPSNVTKLLFINFRFGWSGTNTSKYNILVIVQRDATQNSLFVILQVHFACFGCQPHPSSGVHKTVTTAYGTGQLPPSNVAAWSRCREVTAHKIWPVPAAVVTVLCTPDYRCGWYPNM